MNINNEKLISKLLNFTIIAAKSLSNVAHSIKNAEVAYNEFIANSLRNSIQDTKYLNLTVQTEHLLSNDGRIDITISSRDNIIVACEGVRLRHFNKNIVNQQFLKLEKYSLANASAFFFIIYNETTDFNKSFKKYIDEFSLGQNSELDYTNPNIYTAKNTLNGMPVYHIFANINQEKEEIISKNKLQNITINSFKLFENINIELSPKVNIFLGKNAFGKTSFLQALALANIPDNNTDINNFQGLVKQNYTEAEVVIQRKEEQTSSIIINNNGKISSNIKIDIHEPVFLAYGTNLFSRYTDHNYSKLVNELINGSKKWYFTQSIFEETTASFYDPLGVLNTLHETKGEKAKEIKTFMLKVLNDLLPSEFKISLDTKFNKSYYFIDSSNNYLKTEQLSEGYKNNILLLTDIILRLISINQEKKSNNDILSVFQNTKGIIAIDEFDRHMHPSWQKSYVSDLCKLLPNIQFVFTTHNPISILGRKEGEIQMFYRNKENEIDIKQLPETLAIDAGTVLLTHFDMNSILSDDLQQKIDKFYELKSTIKLSKEEQTSLKNLENTLNNTFVGINIHDFRFLKFLKFLKENNINHRERLEELVIGKEDVNNFRNEFKEYYK